jgi:hypothetical protein
VKSRATRRPSGHLTGSGISSLRNRLASAPRAVPGGWKQWDIAEAPGSPRRRPRVELRGRQASDNPYQFRTRLLARRAAGKHAGADRGVNLCVQRLEPRRSRIAGRGNRALGISLPDGIEQGLFPCLGADRVKVSQSTSRLWRHCRPQELGFGRGRFKGRDGRAGPSQQLLEGTTCDHVGLAPKGSG